MAQRDVAGVARRDGQRYAAELGGGRRWPVGLGVEGDDAGAARLGDPGVQGRQVGDAGVERRVDGTAGGVGGRLAGRRRGLGLPTAAGAGLDHPPGQAAELHQLQEVGQHLRIRVFYGQLAERRGQRRVAIQLHQLARQADLVGEVDQRLAPLVLFDLRGPGQHRVQIAVFIDQRRGGLDADPRRARHIVDAVAAKGLHVHHPLGADAELLHHLGPANADVLHRVQHRHPVADQLHQVLVGGDDHHLAAGVADVAGVGGDDVVGLVARQLQARHAERLCRLAHQRELRDQILGRRRAMGLVVGVKLVAEGDLRLVEHHRQVGRRVGRRLHVDQQLPEHVAEALDRPHRQAVRLAGQRRQGVEGAENEPRPVHQIEPGDRPVLGRRAGNFVQGLGGGLERLGHGWKIGRRWRGVTPSVPFSPRGRRWPRSGRMRGRRWRGAEMEPRRPRRYAEKNERLRSSAYLCDLRG